MRFTEGALYFAEVFERFVRQEKCRKNKGGIPDKNTNVEAQSVTKEDFPLSLLINREGIKTYL